MDGPLGKIPKDVWKECVRKYLSMVDTIHLRKTNKHFYEIFKEDAALKDMNSYVNSGKMYKAGMLGDMELITMFLNKCYPVIHAVEGAARGGHLKVIKRLVKLAVDNLSEFFWYTCSDALMEAARAGRTEIVIYFLNKGTCETAMARRVAKTQEIKDLLQ